MNEKDVNDVQAKTGGGPEGLQAGGASISRGHYNCPLGRLLIYASDQGIRRIELEPSAGPVRPSYLGLDHPAPAQLTGGALFHLKVCLRQLDEYFHHERTDFTVDLDPEGTSFQRSVWLRLRTVPYGEQRSYADIARSLGNVGLSRAVGQANHHNPLPIVVPCHRIVAWDGSLGGYAYGAEAKKFLLAHEQTQVGTRQQTVG